MVDASRIESEGDLPQLYLRPGEMVLAREPTILTTILGSCVAATFWSSRLCIGALCHAMLPRSPTPCCFDASKAELANARRYVDFCIRDLARQFDSLGVPRKEVVVKLFGGADVMNVGTDDLRPTVGRLNCEAAIETLREEQFELAASDLGKTFGRKIRFNTASGHVLLARLS
jgi:chemotaxis protein CheD